MQEKIIKNSLRLRIGKDKKGGPGHIFKAIILHPMETGNRKDLRTGEKVAADYIEQVTVSVDQKIYFEISLGIYVSKNPFISFEFSRDLSDGQIIRVSWNDNLKNEIFYDAIVKFDQTGMFNFSDDSNATKIYQLTPIAKPFCNLETRQAGH